MILLLLATCLQDRLEVADRLRDLGDAWRRKHDDVDADRRAALVKVLNEATSAWHAGDRARAVEGFSIARELIDGRRARLRVVPLPRVMPTGAAAQLTVRATAVGGAEGAALVRLRNRRGEVIEKVEVDLGGSTVLDLSELAEGRYELESEGTTAAVHIVHDLHLRLKKLAADLPVAPETVADAGLVQRLEELREAAAGKPGDGGMDVADELASLERDAAAWADGEDPDRGRTGRRLRASPVEGARVVWQEVVPKSLDAKKPVTVVVALHDAGCSEHAWFDLTDLADRAEKGGFLVAAPRTPGLFGGGVGHVEEVLRIVREERRIGSVWLLGHGQGAGQALALLAQAPRDFAGAVLFAPAAAVDVRRLPDAPIWLACGDGDERASIARGLDRDARAAGRKGWSYVERKGVERQLIVPDAWSAAMERLLRP